MELFDYLTKLLPSTETSRVNDGIKNIRKVINTSAIPALESACSVFTNEYKYKDRDLALLNDLIVKGVKPADVGYSLTRPNSFQLIQHVMRKLETNLDLISDSVISIFKGKAFTSNGLTYNKGNLLQYVEAADFYIRYVRKYYNYATSVELAKLSNIPRPDGVGPDDLEYLKTYMPSFIHLTITFGLDANDTKRVVKKISNMQIAEDVASIQSIVGYSALDPWGFSSLPWPISIIYRYQLNDAEKVLDDYRAAEAEVKAVEYRVLLMQELIDNGHGDAAMEQRLEVYNDRILKNKRIMADIEEKYGV